MASIQAKTVNGKKYWQIVQSKRINGKPRPIVIEHLGTVESILAKLHSANSSLNIKSYSHGLVSALLKLSSELDIVTILNEFTHSNRKSFANKPIRNDLTVGASLLLASIGRICLPTSKRGWFAWAKTTSLPYLMRLKGSDLDSQHFWDMMDSFPTSNIEKAELKILQNIKEKFSIKTDSLFYDTTNFYTYIATTNKRCTIAQRGKNKQKRTDLRQVGLAMIVSKDDLIPIFHETYKGNMNDSPVFKDVTKKIQKRMLDLNMDTSKHTIVFDRGPNSKKNLKLVSDLGLHYVGGLTPSYHKELINDAHDNYDEVMVGGKTMQIFRDKRTIWDDDRTVLVFVSEKLKAGQIRGIYSNIDKKLKVLENLKLSLVKPGTKRYTSEEINKKIKSIVQISNLPDNTITFELSQVEKGRHNLEYQFHSDRLKDVEDSMGFRIIMTSRHEWSTKEIVKSYHGQSIIEQSFRHIKNPFHLAVTPEFHWTDQKIKIHFFTCVLGFMLTTIIWKKMREEQKYKGNLDNLLDMLNNIRLTTVIDRKNKKGKPKVNYQLEECEKEESKAIKILGISDIHEKPVRLRGASVYK